MHIVKEGCPGCGACLGICPVDAIRPQNLGVTVAQTCVDCGLCVAACPVGLIEKAAEVESPVRESSFSNQDEDDVKEGGE